MKITLVTGSRSEYFILEKLIKRLKNNKKFKLSLIVTGSLFSNYFGNISKEISKAKLPLNYKIDMSVKGDSEKDVTNSISLGIKKISKKLKEIKPDLLIVLGDRYETFSATIAACFNRIPIAHIHGGEITQGLVDEAIRHSITKLSHIHFVSNKIYAKRVKQLGEDKSKIFTVGALGVEALKDTKFMTRNEIEKKLKIKFSKKNIIITFHPETLESRSQNKIYLKNLLKALNFVRNTTLIFTMPNADANFKMAYGEIKKFTQKKANSYLFKSLGHQKYFSLCRHSDLMIGNSSSGLIEMPSFKKPTINLGKRQNGRVKAISVLNANFNVKDINKKINYCYTDKFLNKIKKQRNPYDNGKSSVKILKILKVLKINKKILQKKFVDYKNI